MSEILEFDFSKSLAVELLTAKTDRDRQKLIGPSQIPDPCEKHLASSLLGAEEAPQRYWLGAVIGTAIHGLLEDRMAKADGAEDYLIEQKVFINTLEGYGDIYGKADLVIPRKHLLIDWKTTSRKKIRELQNYLHGVGRATDAHSEYTIRKYYGQVQLYMYGLNKAGIQIDNAQLCFISRDGTSENDIWSHTFEYSEEFALQMWGRLERVWRELQTGKKPSDFASDPECFGCKLEEM